MKNYICLLLLAAASFRVHAQCTAPPIAASACASGTAATNNASINSGTTYYVNSTATFSNINLNGGILHICANLTLTTLSYNSGTLIVENGGTLSVSGLASQYLNGNVTIINRGIINISGNITFQNSNNAVYNVLSTSVFSVSGVVTVNSSTTTISNNGTMSLAGLYYQGEVGGFCVGPESQTSFYSLTNATTNSFSYSGAGAPACVNVTGSATLPQALTASSTIHVCQGFTGAPSGSGGWGSATVTTNCNSCTTVLPLGIENFTAVAAGGSVLLHWISGLGPGNNGEFYIEKSTDGVHFNDFGDVVAVSRESEYSFTDYSITAPVLYYRIKAVNVTGITMYSTVVLIESAGAGAGGVSLFPNPSAPNTMVNLVISGATDASARISLITITGEVVSTRIATLTTGTNTISWNPGGLAAGVYVVRVETGGASVYGRLVVRP